MAKRVMLDLYYSLGPAKSLPVIFYVLVSACVWKHTKIRDLGKEIKMSKRKCN